MTDTPTLRAATPADAEAIADIFAHYVINSTATFVTEPPDAATMAQWISELDTKGFPWLVAQDADGAIAGYAYAHPFGDRAGYRYSCETSIYVRHGSKRRGVGTMLISALVEACTARGFRQAFAVIAGTEPASVVLHARAGYRPCGTLENAGRKHGKWIDVFHMQRALGDGGDTPPPDEP